MAIKKKAYGHVGVYTSLLGTPESFNLKAQVSSEYQIYSLEAATWALMPYIMVSPHLGIQVLETDLDTQIIPKTGLKFRDIWGDWRIQVSLGINIGNSVGVFGSLDLMYPFNNFSMGLFMDYMSLQGLSSSDKSQDIGISGIKLSF